jgi:AcrR family transcriptional regulator
MAHALDMEGVGRRRNPAARQQALISAAIEVFASRGYEAATTQQIAACAGCAEGLIHRYFGGKKGLLLALIERRVSQELVDLADHLPLASTLNQEYLQLVQWEIQSMWQDRKFLRVVMSRALVEPAFGKVLSKVGFSRHIPAFVGRLEQFEPYRSLAEDEKQAVAQSIKTLGLLFGFMRPVILGQDRNAAQMMAIRIATIISRGMSAAH